MGENEHMWLTCLSDNDDIEAYLTTLERMMEAYEVEESTLVCHIYSMVTIMFPWLPSVQQGVTVPPHFLFFSSSTSAISRA